MRAIVLAFLLMLGAVVAYRAANPYHRTMFWRWLRKWVVTAIVIGLLLYTFIVFVMHVDVKIL